MSTCFETVYSHPSKIDFIAQAKALGYQIIMVLIHLENPALNQARIASQVSEGGHDVPAEKVRSRIPRLLHEVRASIPLVDSLRIFDNSSAQDPFRPVLSLSDGSLQLQQQPLPDWAAGLLIDTPAP